MCKLGFDLVVRRSYPIEVDTRTSNVNRKTVIERVETANRNRLWGDKNQPIGVDAT